MDRHNLSSLQRTPVCSHRFFRDVLSESRVGAIEPGLVRERLRRAVLPPEPRGRGRRAHQRKARRGARLPRKTREVGVLSYGDEGGRATGVLAKWR